MENTSLFILLVSRRVKNTSIFTWLKTGGELHIAVMHLMGSLSLATRPTDRANRWWLGGISQGTLYSGLESWVLSTSLSNSNYLKDTWGLNAYYDEYDKYNAGCLKRYLN